MAAVIGSTTVLTSHKPLPPAAAPTPAPPTLRLVGFGHAAIAVPADWPRNRSRCGTPQQNTVQIDDPSMYTECGTTRPDNVDSVQMSSSPTVGFQADRTFVIHGLQAERQQTSCRNDWNGTKVCSGVVSIPSLNVWFRAESSTSAENVDRMLSRIQIVPDQVGVPDPWSVTGPPTGPLLSGYTPLLTEAGLKVQSRRVKSPNYPSGTILGVSPATGTMLRLGATVTVTVAK
ncbi:PASTA domain-containing protein [Kribbella sp.]|uniref:PASTA domain-containing protein n=1 Tax=Kribbella sp. TaxID=1871183 RepID=UPI002D677796|nr:PASTA domain-containing protein [Kribbella sp.]HZX01887.1 PASTA domain-containing protein [Kribbella sp.]